MVCTDWSVTGDHKAMDVFVDGKVWGVEKLTMAERHYKVLMAGADQFGGKRFGGRVGVGWQRITG